MILLFYLNCCQQLSPPPHQHKSTKHNTIIMSQSSLLTVRYTQVINQAVAEWMSRPSPPSTPCHSDVEDDDCDSVDQSQVEAGVVGALMSLGGGGAVGFQEEMVGEEDEYGWAPQQSEM